MAEEKTYKCDGCNQPISTKDEITLYIGKIDNEVIILLKMDDVDKASFHLHGNNEGSCYGKLISRFHNGVKIIIGKDTIKEDRK